MNPPDDSTFRVLDWIGGAFMALLSVIWKQQHEKVVEVKSEIDKQRDHIEKLFDKFDKHAAEQHERHIELLTAIHTGLASKQDK